MHFDTFGNLMSIVDRRVKADRTSCTLVGEATVHDEALAVLQGDVIFIVDSGKARHNLESGLGYAEEIVVLQAVLNSCAGENVPIPVARPIHHREHTCVVALHTIDHGELEL
jgi:hypothetical protein